MHVLVVPAMQYYCPLQGSACTDCWKRGIRRNALLAANCTDTAVMNMCNGNAGPGAQLSAVVSAPAVESAPIGPGVKLGREESAGPESQATQALAARVQMLEEQLSQVVASLDAKRVGR